MNLVVATHRKSGLMFCFTNKAVLKSFKRSIRKKDWKFKKWRPAKGRVLLR